MKHPTESSVKEAVFGSRVCLGHDSAASGQTKHGGSGCKGNYRETNTDVWFVSFHSIHFTHRVGQKEPKAKVRLGLVVRGGALSRATLSWTPEHGEIGGTDNYSLGLPLPFPSSPCLDSGGEMEFATTHDKCVSRRQAMIRT